MKNSSWYYVPPRPRPFIRCLSLPKRSDNIEETLLFMQKDIEKIETLNKRKEIVAKRPVVGQQDSRFVYREICRISQELRQKAIEVVSAGIYSVLSFKYGENKNLIVSHEILEQLYEMFKELVLSSPVPYRAISLSEASIHKLKLELLAEKVTKFKLAEDLVSVKKLLFEAERNIDELKKELVSASSCRRELHIENEKLKNDNIALLKDLDSLYSRAPPLVTQMHSVDASFSSHCETSRPEGDDQNEHDSSISTVETLDERLVRKNSMENAVRVENTPFSTLSDEEVVIGTCL